jgi:hypothetical protein
MIDLHGHFLLCVGPVCNDWSTWKSVLTTLQTLNDKIEKLDKTIQTLNNAEVIERLSALELKVDELMSKKSRKYR